MTEEMVPVSLDDPMTFECSPGVSCFNQCCRDLNQFLMPYDIIRLKNNLGLSSGSFLNQYTLSHFGPESGFPVVTLKFDSGSDLACPFVTNRGCSVYPDRPASCRMYPVARAISRSRETGEVAEYFALVEEPHCRGFGIKEGQTVGQWLAGQDVVLHNQMNDKLMELISLKNRLMPGELEQGLAEKFYLACYDMDAFKREVFAGNLLEGFSVPDAFLDKAGKDETVLLDLGIAWLKFVLFGVEYDEHGQKTKEL